MKPLSTHCRNGHEYTEANVYRTPGRADRRCRTCTRIRTGTRPKAEYLAAVAAERPSLRESIESRLSRDPSGCLVWTGTRDTSGYGMFRHALVHRTYYQMMVGPIPEGLTLDHLCRNRVCANPDHLEPVTNAVNVLRGVSFAAVNAKKTHCSKGHAYDAKNTYIRPKTGHRACLTCTAARGRARRERLHATNEVSL